MAHENINSYAQEDARVKVIWNKGSLDYPEAIPVDGFVQVMSEFQDSNAVFPQRAASGETAYVPEEKCTGFAVMLDREGINRLIRMLRKARDAAFGSDA